MEDSITAKAEESRRGSFRTVQAQGCKWRFALKFFAFFLLLSHDTLTTAFTAVSRLSSHHRHCCQAHCCLSLPRYRMLHNSAPLLPPLLGFSLRKFQILLPPSFLRRTTVAREEMCSRAITPGWYPMTLLLTASCSSSPQSQSSIVCQAFRSWQVYQTVRRSFRMRCCVSVLITMLGSADLSSFDYMRRRTCHACFHKRSAFPSHRSLAPSISFSLPLFITNLCTR